MTTTIKDLPDILASHLKWVRGEEGGARANLSGADLSRADLSRANLYEADLSGADLTGANLYEAKRREDITINRAPLFVNGLCYRVMIFDAHMQIGCELHRLSEWAAFDSGRIAKMDGTKARKFWDQYKDALLGMAKADGRDFSEWAALEDAP